MECIFTKRKKVLLTVILIIASMLFTACGVYFVVDYLHYRSMTNIGAINQESSSEASFPPKNVDVPIDFEELKTVNEDIYAWIRIPYANETDKYIVDYPILQNPNERDYYLTNNVNRQKSAYGAIYTQYLNNKDFDDFNTLIYGHNMRNGTMFGSLKKYRSREFFDANRDIIIYMPNRILKYKIFGAYVFDNRHILMYFDNDNLEDRQDYLDTVFATKSLSANFDKEIPVDINDNIITLSTCTSNDSQRYLVQGILVYDSDVDNDYRKSK